VASCVAVAARFRLVEVAREEEAAGPSRIHRDVEAVEGAKVGTELTDDGVEKRDIGGGPLGGSWGLGVGAKQQ
jgi:hypothetical protein